MKKDTTQKGLFITGTDTDVGKTYIGSQIAIQLDGMGISVVPRKPIESGCQLSDGELQPEDAKKYFDAVKGKVPLEDICPFRFQPAISPQRAARLANTPINTKDTIHACMKNVSEMDYVVVEGAGGFYSPICEDGLNADLAIALQLPILLIANDQLGCINHILLTIEAIEKRNLKINAVVLNSQQQTHDDAMNNVEDLKALVDIPVFSVGKDEKLNRQTGLVKHISKVI
ncbi:MAG: dethiobiotin synthase [Gammaproteobacteria bacterium]